MKTCSHCGNLVQDEAEICMKCGCMVENKFSITFNREKQWFLINPAMQIQISGNNSHYSLSVRSGESQSIKLSPGNYYIHVKCSIRTQETHLTLNRNVSYRLAFNRFSGAIEFWEI